MTQARTARSLKRLKFVIFFKFAWGPTPTRFSRCARSQARSLAMSLLAVFATIGAAAAEPRGVLALLLAEGRISIVDVADGREVGSYAASDHPAYRLSAPAQLLTKSGDEIFAVLPTVDRMVVAAIDARTFAGRQVATLTAQQYRALAIGARTGRLFVFGSTGVVVMTPKTTEARVLTAGSQIVWGAVSRDEKRVYASYHGPGIEWFEETADGWKSAGHLMSHGNFVLLDNTLLAATGEGEIIEANDRGDVVRRFDTRLAGNHLMEFGVDQRQEAIYAVGACDYAGGFTVTPRLAGASARVVLPVGNFDACGDRIAVAPDSAWIAVLVTSGPPSDLKRTVKIVDTKSGQILRTMTASSEVIDVLALPQQSQFAVELTSSADGGPTRQR